MKKKLISLIKYIGILVFLLGFGYSVINVNGTTNVGVFAIVALSCLAYIIYDIKQHDATVSWIFLLLFVFGIIRVALHTLGIWPLGQEYYEDIIWSEFLFGK